MKYRLFFIIPFAVVFIIAASMLAFIERDEIERYHQHTDEEPKAECAHGNDVFCTHLPVIQIDTGGTEIPGKLLPGRNTAYTVAEDGSDTIVCGLKLTDNEGKNNHFEDVPAVESLARIRVRGRSSRLFDKLGYAIRLVDENGENNPQMMAGMDSHHEWALHGPFLDKTLLRNYMWYNIAGEIMDYAPNVRFCELFINGEYMGVYVLVETITAGENGARLNLSVDKKDNSFTGYLLRMDNGSDNPIKNIEPFSVYSYRFPNGTDIVYPGAKNLTEEIAEGIRQDFSDFEKAVYSFDYDNDKYGYETLIDVESFVDYFIINEFALNYDAGWLSTYIYKDIDGKFRMCIWDFNSACDNYQESHVDNMNFYFQYNVWYVMMMKDEKFVEAIIERYEELRKGILSEEYLMNYIDETIEYLGPAIDRNYEKWGYIFDEDHNLLITDERNPRSYEEAIEQIKTAIIERGKWMDENIHTLRQYAAESKVKKYNEHTD